MDKSILVQKQIRDNAQDLQSFMSDMKNWETDMKKKEAELSGLPFEQDLPPVRSKLKKAKPVINPLPKTFKRISGSDYSAWDKFDVDKACEQIDEEEIGPTSLDSKMSVEQRLMKLKDEAQKEKERGNKFFASQNWDEAISCYNRAIELYKDDAIFYANRSLCYLKKENLHAAEADCTKALSLDPNYVKALQRRSCAREALGSLRSAAQDLHKILKLEPANQAAKVKLEALTQRMGTKGPKFKSSPATTPTADCAPDSFLTQNGIDPTDEKKEPKTPTIEIKQTEAIHSTAPGTVQPIYKPPHLRSKTPLVRVPITEVSLGCTQSHSLIENSNVKNITSNGDIKIHPVVDKNSIIVESENQKLCENKLQNMDIKTNDKKNDVSVDLGDLCKNELTEFQVPKSSVQFVFQWRLLRGRDRERSKYLKSIPPSELPSIFQNFLESDTLSEILDVLCKGDDFVEKDNILPLKYLEYLSQVKRFSALAMFLSSNDKKAVHHILQHCRDTGICTDNEIDQIKNKFEI